MGDQRGGDPHPDSLPEQVPDDNPDSPPAEQDDVARGDIEQVSDTRAEGIDEAATTLPADEPSAMSQPDDLGESEAVDPRVNGS